MIFGVALSPLFIIQGLRTISRFVIWLFQLKKSQEWPATRGVITRSDLQSVFIPRGGRKSHNNIDGSVRLATAYYPNIIYEYRINTASFQSRQLYIGQQSTLSLDVANDFVEKYHVGKDVVVYYNPERPEIAILEQGRFKELTGYLVSGIIFLLLGFAILIQVINE